MLRIATSTLSKAQKDILNRISANTMLQINVQSSPGPSDTDFLVMGQLQSTPKLFLALVYGIKIVNFDFLLELEKTGKEPPNYEKYVPAKISLIDPSVIGARRDIMAGLVLIVSDEKESAVIKQIVEAAGGRLKLFAGSTLDEWKFFMLDILSALIPDNEFIVVRESKILSSRPERLEFLSSMQVPVLGDAVLCAMVGNLKKGPVFKRTFRADLDTKPSLIPQKRTMAFSSSQEAIIPPTPKNASIHHVDKSSRLSVGRDSQGVHISTKSLYSHYTSLEVSDAEEDYSMVEASQPQSIQAPVSAKETFQTFQTQPPAFSTLDSFMDDILGLGAAGDNKRYDFLEPKESVHVPLPPRQPPPTMQKEEVARKSYRVPCEDVEEESVPAATMPPPPEAKSRGKRRDWTIKESLTAQVSEDEEEEVQVVKKKKTTEKKKNKAIVVVAAEEDEVVIVRKEEANKKKVSTTVDPASISVNVTVAELVKKPAQTKSAAVHVEGVVNFKRFRKSGVSMGAPTVHRISKLITVVPSTAFQ